MDMRLIHPLAKQNVDELCHKELHHTKRIQTSGVLGVVSSHETMHVCSNISCGCLQFNCVGKGCCLVVAYFYALGGATVPFGTIPFNG